jgi:hypothetical protein
MPGVGDAIESRGMPDPRGQAKLKPGDHRSSSSNAWRREPDQSKIVSGRACEVGRDENSAPVPGLCRVGPETGG